MGGANKKAKLSCEQGSLRVFYRQSIGDLVRLQIVFCDEQGEEVISVFRDLDPGEDVEIKNLNWEITALIV